MASEHIVWFIRAWPLLNSNSRLGAVEILVQHAAEMMASFRCDYYLLNVKEGGHMTYISDLKGGWVVLIYKPTDKSWQSGVAARINHHTSDLRSTKTIRNC